MKLGGKQRVPRPEDVAVDAARELARMARPIGEFDPTRYFRGDQPVKFHGVTSPVVRDVARTIDRLYGDVWGVKGALEFAEALLPSDYLDEKGLGIELLARHVGELRPKHMAVFRRWLRAGWSANWATTDSICGFLLGPLIVDRPALAVKLLKWAKDGNMWVRRASAVALIRSVARGTQLDIAYLVAQQLHEDPADLIQKAVGWLLREAGKADPRRLEKYLRENGRVIPRTTIRYAIERFSDPKRNALLRQTRA